MELRVVTSTTDFGLANVLKGVLESAGIETELGGVGIGNVYPGTDMATISLLVRAEDYARARDLIDQVDDQGFPEEEEDEA
jgi:hypothetical protein